MIFLLVALLLADVSSAATRKTRRRASSTRAKNRATLLVPTLILPSDASPWDRLVGQSCVSALGRKQGAVVAMDPRNGRVLAIVNPVDALLKSYTPCSVFKIVVAIAGLSEGTITPESIYNCAGGCWKRGGHGPINLRRALAVSCNPYFEWIGETLGYEKIREYANYLGLGSVSGINLTGENAGCMPAEVHESRVGLLSSHAKGVTMSAVQMAVLISAAINGGVVYQPQVNRALGFVPRDRVHLPSPRALEALQPGLAAAVVEGSATRAYDPFIPVGGKTGSCAHLGWFASYARVEQPELVVIVLLRPGNGHLASAIAGRVYQALYPPAPGVPAQSASAPLASDSSAMAE